LSWKKTFTTVVYVNRDFFGFPSIEEMNLRMSAVASGSLF
jgi:hypothetical protein